jgi:DNA-binding HxlR family transcriptional regulator
VRSGAHTLALLSAHRNCTILRALDEGPKRQMDLRCATGSPAQTTLRAHLKALEDVGAIAKQRRNAFPGNLEYELEKPGRELLFVANVLERWLSRSPDVPLGLGSDAARAAIKALVEGWSTAMLRALAARPLSLTDLDRVIGDLNYPSLERRLAAMRLAGLVEAMPGNGRGTPYGVTAWLRQAVAPLAAATRWERRHLPDRTAAPGRLDAEAAFLLAVPLLRLPTDVSGGCRLTMEITNGGGKQRLAGVLVELEAGRARSCTSKLEGSPNAWATGSLTAWLSAVIEADSDRLELGGDCALARGVVDGLHGTLFGRGVSQQTL